MVKFEVGDILVQKKEHIKKPDFYIFEIIETTEIYIKYKIIYSNNTSGDYLNKYDTDLRTIETIEKYCKKASNPKLIKALYCD